MDQCTKEVRLQNWKNIISECQARPDNQTAKQWMDEHNICEQTYYVWQRRIRQAAYDEMTSMQDSLPDASPKAEVAFTEIQMPVHDMPVPVTEHNTSTVAVLRTNTCTIEISNNISDRMLSLILQEASHA